MHGCPSFWLVVASFFFNLERCVCLFIRRVSVVKLYIVLLDRTSCLDIEIFFSTDIYLPTYLSVCLPFKKHIHSRKSIARARTGTRTICKVFKSSLTRVAWRVAAVLRIQRARIRILMFVAAER